MTSLKAEQRRNAQDQLVGEGTSQHQGIIAHLSWIGLSDSPQQEATARVWFGVPLTEHNSSSPCSLKTKIFLWLEKDHTFLFLAFNMVNLSILIYVTPAWDEMGDLVYSLLAKTMTLQCEYWNMNIKIGTVSAKHSHPSQLHQGDLTLGAVDDGGIMAICPLAVDTTWTKVKQPELVI